MSAPATPAGASISALPARIAAIDPRRRARMMTHIPALTAVCDDACQIDTRADQSPLAPT
jgi:hypothetical protein